MLRLFTNKHQTAFKPFFSRIAAPFRSRKNKKDVKSQRATFKPLLCCIASPFCSKKKHNPDTISIDTRWTSEMTISGVSHVDSEYRSSNEYLVLAPSISETSERFLPGTPDTYIVNFHETDDDLPKLPEIESDFITKVREWKRNDVECNTGVLENGDKSTESTTPLLDKFCDGLWPGSDPADEIPEELCADTWPENKTPEIPTTSPEPLYEESPPSPTTKTLQSSPRIPHPPHQIPDNDNTGGFENEHVPSIRCLEFCADTWPENKTPEIPTIGSVYILEKDPEEMDWKCNTDGLGCGDGHKIPCLTTIESKLEQQQSSPRIPQPPHQVPDNDNTVGLENEKVTSIRCLEFCADTWPENETPEIPTIGSVYIDDFPIVSDVVRHVVEDAVYECEEAEMFERDSLTDEDPPQCTSVMNVRENPQAIRDRPASPYLPTYSPSQDLSPEPHEINVLVIETPPPAWVLAPSLCCSPPPFLSNTPTPSSSQQMEQVYTNPGTIIPVVSSESLESLVISPECGDICDIPDRFYGSCSPPEMMFATPSPSPPQSRIERPHRAPPANANNIYEDEDEERLSRQIVELIDNLYGNSVRHVRAMNIDCDHLDVDEIILLRIDLGSPYCSE